MLALLLALLAALTIVRARPAKCKRTSLLPPDYLQPKFQQSRANTNGYSQQTIGFLLQQHGSTEHGPLGGGWIAQNGFNAIAGYDYLGKTQTFREWVGAAQVAWCNTAKSEAPYNQECINSFNDDIGWTGLANIQAYEAYGDVVFLDRAKELYEFLSAHGYIKQSDLDAGHLEDTKALSNKLKKDCNGKSMLGGADWKNGAPNGGGNEASKDSGVNAVSTGTYAWLAAKLCRHLKDDKYCDRAYSSLQWLDRHLVRDSGLVWDHIIGSSCNKKEWTFTYNAGLYIGAYAELHRIKANSTALSLARKTALASMSPTAPWNTKRGIIKEGQGAAGEVNDGISFKAILIRSLYSSIDVFPADIQVAIRQYINIQYYALTNFASNDPKRPVEYGRNWTGPGFERSTAQTLIVSLDVLNAVSKNPDGAFPGSGERDRAVVDVVPKSR